MYELQNDSHGKNVLKHSKQRLLLGAGSPSQIPPKIYYSWGGLNFFWIGGETGFDGGGAAP